MNNTEVKLENKEILIEKQKEGYTSYIAPINTRYSNFITLDMIDSWNIDMVQFLNGGTGTGKTTFILKVISNFARKNNYKILYLCNRKKLNEQMKRDIELTNSSDVITLMSYQSLEESIDNNFIIGDFNIIVCDECHYFINDANFRELTDLSYNWILNQTNTYKIFMSATGKSIINKLRKSKKIDNVYTIPKDYSYVSNIHFIVGDKDIKNMIQSLMLETPENEKIIYFCRKATDAYELYRKYEKNACFYVSNNNILSKYNTYTDVEKKDIFIRNSTDGKQVITFPKKILFTTCVLDNGVNIIDRNVKHIVTDLIDHDKLIQCLGRKRVIDKEDTCKFYIKNWSKQELSRFRNGLYTSVKPAMLYEDDVEEFKKVYLGSVKAQIQFKKQKYVYHNESGELRLMECSFQKAVNDILDLEIIINFSNFETSILCNMAGYDNKIIDDLKDKVSHISFQDNGKDELENYLESIVGKKIYTKDEEKKTLIEMIGLKDNRKRLIKDFDTLTAHLTNKYNSKFTLVKATDWDRKLENGLINEKYGKVYWLIK